MPAMQIENRGRSVWHFQVYRTVTLANGKTRRNVLDRDAQLVVGDAADVDRAPGKLTPSPVVNISEQRWEELGPSNQLAIEKLISDKVFIRRAI